MDQNLNGGLIVKIFDSTMLDTKICKNFEVKAVAG